MKKYILLIAVFLIVAGNSMSQIFPSPEYAAPEKRTHMGTDRYVNDSSWYSLGNTFGQSWFNFKTYRVQQRNNAGNLLTASDYEYDTLGLFWYEQRRYQGQFINDTIQNMWYSYIYDKNSGTWEMSDSIHFNIYGNPITSWFKEWDPFENKFVRGKRTKFYYSDEGVLHLIFNQLLDTISGNWKKDNYEAVFYNEYGLDSLHQIYKWNGAAQQWADSLKISVTYDEKLNPDETIHKIWTGNNWQNYKKWDHFFNSANLISELYEYKWEEALADWTFKGYTEYNYYQDQDLKERIEYLWDGSTWLNKVRVSYTYFATGRQQEILNEYWSFGSNIWKKTSQNNYEYDENNNRVLFTFLFWDDVNNQWRNIYKEENFWSLFQPQTIPEREVLNFSIFPNPADDFITIIADDKIQNSKFRQLLIFSSDGRLVSSQPWAGSGQQLNISNLSTGNYILVLKTETGIGSTGFVKK